MIWRCVGVVWLWLLLGGVAAAQSPGLDCERAGAAAERAAGLPSGLLLAIGKVESGRFDGFSERREPWPWAVDVGGTPLFLANVTDAVAAVRGAAANGVLADVGCFQISLLYHPHAFASLAEAFDPGANARYAAGFLSELYARTGSWPAAVALYHSATPALGEPYAACARGLAGGRRASDANGSGGGRGAGHYAWRAGFRGVCGDIGLGAAAAGGRWAAGRGSVRRVHTEAVEVF